MNRARQLAKRSLLVLTLVVLALVSWTYLATASHNFTDVPDSLGVFHSAVEWMKNRAITGGCTTTEYCPNSPVTRVQMALFMQRLGGVLTPAILNKSEAVSVSSGIFNLCWTTSFPTTGHPRQALLYARMSTAGSSAHHQEIATKFSIDGGATWSYTDLFVFSSEDAAGANQWASTTYIVDFPMNVGTNYVFAVELFTTAPVNAECHLHAQIINRNPATSPLRPVPEITREQKRRP